MVTKRFYTFAGLSRSGNHPVIFWMLHQLEGMHFDGIDQYSLNAICRFNRRHISLSKSIWMKPYKRKRVMLFNKRDPDTLNAIGSDMLLNKELVDLKKMTRTIRLREDNEMVVVSYENQRLDKLSDKPKQDIFGEIKEFRKVLILRDVFNLFASRLAMLRKDNRPDEDMETYPIMYLNYANEFLNNTKKMGDKFSINFNQWHSDKYYRECLAKDMGLYFTDEASSYVSQVGGGSSFCGTKFSGKAKKMKLNSRWKSFVDDDFYKSLLNKDVIEISNEIFGKIPGTEVLFA